MNGHQPLELPSHEVLSLLARDDPLAYETLRREMIERFIDSAPERIKPRLNGIQFRVESVRQLSGSALGATVKLYQLMWESFHRLNHNWQDLVNSKAGEVNPHDSTLGTRYQRIESASVLEFRPRHHHKSE